MPRILRGPTREAIVKPDVPAIAMRNRHVWAETQEWNDTGMHRIWRQNINGRPYGSAIMAYADQLTRRNGRPFK